MSPVSGEVSNDSKAIDRPRKRDRHERALCCLWPGMGPCHLAVQPETIPASDPGIPYRAPREPRLLAGLVLHRLQPFSTEGLRGLYRFLPKLHQGRRRPTERAGDRELFRWICLLQPPAIRQINSSSVTVLHGYGEASRKGGCYGESSAGPRL